LISFQDCGLSNMPNLSVSREVIGMLQDHYPERLGQAFIIDAPWVMSAFFNAVSAFVDPVTREKFQFVTEEGEARAARMSQYFDLACLEPEFCGQATEPFNSHVFIRAAKGPGEEFGLEFNEQAALVRDGAVRLDGLGADQVPAGMEAPKGPAWEVLSDMRVLALPRRERALVRSLSSALARSSPSHSEDSAGLFDDAGSLIRYLRSESWDLARAEERIRSTARWRKEFGLSGLRAGARMDAIARENEAGRLYVRGFDKVGRPVLHVKFCCADLGSHDDTITHAIYCVERAVACLEQHEAELRLAAGGGEKLLRDLAGEGRQPPDGRFALLVDFAGYSRQNRPAFRTLRQLATILQDHYPERLAAAFLVNPPIQVRLLWKALSMVLAGDTQKKVRLVKGPEPEELRTAFDEESLEESLGGRNGEPFKSEVFLNVAAANLGSVYGAEYDAQVAAMNTANLHGDVAEQPIVSNVGDVSSRAALFFKLESLFGGGSGDSPLW